MQNGSAAAVRDGFAAFSFLSVDVVGSGYYFLFVMGNTDGKNITVTSSTFDVLPGAAVAFKITVQPADNCRPGFPLLPQPEILAVDSGGNPANSSISVQVKIKAHHNSSLCFIFKASLIYYELLFNWCAGSCFPPHRSNWDSSPPW
jgi:hypothetical protein